MPAFTAADAVRWVSRAIDRPVDVVIANTGRPSDEALARHDRRRLSFAVWTVLSQRLLTGVSEPRAVQSVP
jgi:hypothetical protein